MRSHGTCSGFTLLEVLIAIAILAISLTVIYGSQSQGVSLATEAKFNTTAAFLLNRKVAELQNGTTELRDDEANFGEDYPDYIWKIEIDDAELGNTPYGEALGNSFKRARLTVSWESSPYSHTVDYYFQDQGEF